MAFNKSTCQLVILACLAIRSASGASITTCTISTSPGSEILTASSGPTGCRVDLPSIYPGTPRYGSASFVDNDWIMMHGTARAEANNYNDEQRIRVETEAYGSGQDYAFFSNIAAGNFLQIDFRLTPWGVDTSFEFSFNGADFNSYGDHSIQVPIDPGISVSINPYLRISCINYCFAGTQYNLLSLDVVNAIGESQSGYQSGFASGRRFASGPQYFPGGEQTIANPEPGSVVMVLLGLGLLVGSRRRRNCGTIRQ